MRSANELVRDALLTVMTDGCWRDDDDLEKACGGGYADALEELINEGRVGVVYTAEYGDIYWRTDVVPPLEWAGTILNAPASDPVQVYHPDATNASVLQEAAQ